MLKSTTPDNEYFGIPEYYIPINEFNKLVEEFELVDSLEYNFNKFIYKTNPNYPNVQIALFHTSHLLIIESDQAQVWTGVFV